MLFLKGAASTPWMSPLVPSSTPGSPSALGANGTCGDGGNCVCHQTRSGWAKTPRGQGPSYHMWTRPPCWNPWS